MVGGSRKGWKNRALGGSRIRVERYLPLHDTVLKTVSCSVTTWVLRLSRDGHIIGFEFLAGLCTVRTHTQQIATLATLVARGAAGEGRWPAR